LEQKEVQQQALVRDLNVSPLGTVGPAFKIVLYGVEGTGWVR
jgi:hypothetical protein